VAAAIEVQTFKSAEDFILLLRRSHAQWIGERDTDSGWLFRGQHSVAHKLVPSAFRNTDELVANYATYSSRYYTGRDWYTRVNWPSSKADPEGRVPAVAFEAQVHAALMRKFALFADDVRHPVRIPDFLWHLFSESEDALGRYFRGEVRNDEVELFAVAQHHGISTPFLDWTYVPIIAAYFAAEQAYLKNTTDGIALWALRSELFNREWTLRRLTVRGGITPFLDAQKGLFTWCPAAYSLKVDRGYYVPFEELVVEHFSDSSFVQLKAPYLYKLVLPSTEVLPLLKLLWRERVTPAHLMPTFDNISRAIKLELQWRASGGAA
jgi:hypothetical protein